MASLQVESCHVLRRWRTSRCGVKLKNDMPSEINRVHAIDAVAERGMLPSVLYGLRVRLPDASDPLHR